MKAFVGHVHIASESPLTRAIPTAQFTEASAAAIALASSSAASAAFANSAAAAASVVIASCVGAVIAPFAGQPTAASAAVAAAYTSAAAIAAAAAVAATAATAAAAATATATAATAHVRSLLPVGLCAALELWAGEYAVQRVGAATLMLHYCLCVADGGDEAAAALALRPVHATLPRKGVREDVRPVRGQLDPARRRPAALHALLPPLL